MSNLKDSLSGLFSDKTLESADKYRDKLRIIDKALEGLNAVVSATVTPMDALSDSIGRGSDSLKAFNEMTNKMAFSMASAAEKLGPAGREIAAGILASANAVVTMNEEITKLGGTLDSSTSNIRDYRSEMFQVASSFGEGYEESEKLSKSLAGMSDDISSRSVIGFGELKDAMSRAMDGMSNMGIHYDKLFGTIETGAGSFKSLEAAILLSRKSGEDIRTTMNFVTQAVQKNGMSVEDAITQYSAFFDTAEKSGLKFEEVRSTLSSIASSYSMIGINADFARPIIETFGRSLEQTGLGISNATRLSESLSRSFTSVANSYEKAYLMVQKGGLEVGDGGGGALGASIGLRARILRAEKAGDQSSIGLEMAESMKKTLESMSGSRLISLEEAADGGQRERDQFFKQESLMNSMFGIDKDSAARTIEMLKQLDDTTVMSNDALKEELGKNIGDQLKNQDKNLGYQERIAASTENMFASSILTNEILMKIVDTTNESAASVANTQSSIVSSFYDNTFDVASSMASSTSKLISDAEGKLLTMSNQLSQFGAAGTQGLINSAGAGVIANTANKTIDAAGNILEFDWAENISKGDSEIITAITNLTNIISPGSVDPPTF